MLGGELVAMLTATICLPGSWPRTKAGKATEHSMDFRLRGGRVIELWRIDYNTQRLRTSLGGFTPITFANRSMTDHNTHGLRL